MKITWPPPQVIFVGFESNQQGQAASQEHASSNWPETFHGAFFSSAVAARAPARRSVRTKTGFVRMPNPFLSFFLSFFREKHTAGGERPAERRPWTVRALLVAGLPWPGARILRDS